MANTNNIGSKRLTVGAHYGMRDWLAQLLGRTHQNVVVVALANKLVRMAWAVLCKNERYRAPVLGMTN